MEETSCESLKNNVDELKGHLDSLTKSYDQSPWIFLRCPKKYSNFLIQMSKHVEGFLEQEMNEELILQILKSKNAQIEKLQSNFDELNQEKTKNDQKMLNEFDERI